MTKEEQNIMLQLEWERAWAFLDEARALLDNNMLLAVAHNIYYGLFHAICAMNIQSGYPAPSTHKGLLNQFYLNYVKPGILNQEDNKVCVKAEELRTLSDYDGKFKPAKDDLEANYQDVRRLVSKMMDYAQA